MKFLILNGPNINLARWSEPGVPGEVDYNGLMDYVQAGCDQLGIETDICQSNHEGELIEQVHRAADEGWPVIINPGGFTHTSVALRDALAEVADGAGFVEVHLTNVHAREAFRQHSYLSPIARGVIAGLGSYGYVAALGYFLAN